MAALHTNRTALRPATWGCLLLLAMGSACAVADDTVFVGDLEGCGPPVVCCDPPACTDCCGERLWVRADYLTWWLTGTDLPPLVTASPTGTSLADAGVLGEPSTSILAGDHAVGDNLRSGYRLVAGWWLDDCQRFAIVGDYFDAGTDGYQFLQGSDPALIVTRPFYNTELDQADTELVSLLNELDGTVTVAASDELRSAGVAGQLCVRSCCDPCSCDSSRVDLIGGYRHYQYNSRLSVFEDLTVLPGTSQPLVPGTTIQVLDRFHARNEFHGGEIGVKARKSSGVFWLEGQAALAIGANHRSLVIDGSTVNTVPSAGSATMAGGLLTSDQTNIGRYSDTKTEVIPSFRLALGCQLAAHLSGYAGYNLVVWNDVLQAAYHLPPGLEVDPRNLPPVVTGGGAAPAFAGLRGQRMVAHGFDFGLELTY